ncbi:hypothetical protein [Lewinella sp. IMCC34191]|uniref:hypothetical protein n=1 Tax=Lewinella sp. IMCC34191 TaxID=2259172 RepID=UPI001300A139|nr:hypothetical protein [Lewinella sp. IMCC34191]
MSTLNVVVIVATVFTIYRLWDQEVEWIHFLAPAAGILVVVALTLVTLRTRITSDRIEIGFRPFTNKVIRRSEISSAYVRQYSPLAEYGGWGYRVGRRGKAYNTMGDQGLQLELMDGSRILIGTQRPREMERVLESWL